MVQAAMDDKVVYSVVIVYLAISILEIMFVFTSLITLSCTTTLRSACSSSVLAVLMHNGLLPTYLAGIEVQLLLPVVRVAALRRWSGI
jgi:hypothetical protein